MKWCPVRVCCAGNLQDKDVSLTVYYICGYVSFNCILYLWICFV